MGLLSSTHPQSRSVGFEPRTFDLARECSTFRPLSWHRTLLMSNFGQSMISSNYSSIV
ncbi:unnamed protein product [Schistosoma curassoni]|nr:unnamed protein product [Schistosoma curassoni]